MAAASRQAAAAPRWDLGDVDRLAPHQANHRITSFVARQFGAPRTDSSATWPSSATPARPLPPPPSHSFRQGAREGIDSILH
ncbi:MULTISPECIES: hypothetical protein [unclassified Streptomyces]|uniref:hypothetical protein n=1 Tax=unclassified Streptomyces TaxID=2593676 RepID=UPI0005EBF644|nr:MULTISPECIES: hypothetical protein [unclassified Streptomyces]APU43217.1 hypothetical protein BSL84_29070 [Streptomyces sp. TN58]KJK45700.1 hypothetical protein UK14_25500 [Streptomyces sp. NRRL F-4428]